MGFVLASMEDASLEQSSVFPKIDDQKISRQASLILLFFFKLTISYIYSILDVYISSLYDTIDHSARAVEYIKNIPADAVRYSPATVLDMTLC